MLIHDRGHLNSRPELTGLGLRGENGNLRARQVFQNDFGHPGERPPRVVFEHEHAKIGAYLGDLSF